jgi:hypothetical protein
MCLFRKIRVERPIISNEVLLIKKDDFVHLGDEIYLRVLASDKRGEEISKSYYYFIVNRLRQMGLLLDNAISFKAVFPFEVTSNGISLTDSIMFITDDKTLVYYNSENTVYSCESCPVTLECINGFKSVVREVKVEIRNDELDDAWLSLISGLKFKLLSNIKFARVKADIGNINLKERTFAKQLKVTQIDG